MWENYGDKPPNPLNKTWVFKIKDKTHGEFKGRLCVQGFNQIHSTDYEETYTPNGKLLTLRILLLYSLHKNLKVTQFDVQGAFLHAHLSEDVSIKTSKGVNWKTLYLKLKKFLYGLKQSPKNFYEHLTKWLNSIWFQEPVATLACTCETTILQDFSSMSMILSW